MPGLGSNQWGNWGREPSPPYKSREYNQFKSQRTEPVPKIEKRPYTIRNNYSNIMREFNPSSNNQMARMKQLRSIPFTRRNWPDMSRQISAGLQNVNSRTYKVGSKQKNLRGYLNHYLHNPEAELNPTERALLEHTKKQILGKPWSVKPKTTRLTLGSKQKLVYPENAELVNWNRWGSTIEDPRKK